MGVVASPSHVASASPHTLPLLQRGVPPTGDSPPPSAPAWVLPTGRSLPQTAPVRVLFMGCSPLNIHLLHHGPPWLQGTSLPHHGLHHGLRGKALLRRPEHLLPLLLHWPWGLQSCFSHIFSLCSSDCCCCCADLSPLPPLTHYPRGAPTVADGLSLGQQWARLGARWHWLCRTQGKLPAASRRSHPCTPFCYQNLATQTQCKSSTSKPVFSIHYMYTS